MSVSILLLTHETIGSTLFKAAIRTLGSLPTKVLAIPVSYDCDPELDCGKINRVIDDLQMGDGVLILTDLYGATPTNLAQRFNDGKTVRVVSGVNLSMLIRVINYAHLDLTSLTEKALSGGKDGIMLCEKKLENQSC